MRELIDQAWKLYRDFETSGFVVTPSIPILFFGDLEAYRRSQLRIITVGLNPSRVEFPRDAPSQDGFRRFPNSRAVYPGILGGEGRDEYISSLSEYFCTDPYRSWFSSFEQILKGLGSSFYPGSSSTALHTDLCTPLATDPTWNPLPPSAKAQLETSGARLWHQLVEELQPNVIVLSVARPHLDKIRFQSLSDWQVVHTVERKRDGEARRKPYTALMKAVRVGPELQSLLVFGSGANTPFGSLLTADKVAIGQAVRRQLHA